MRVVYLRCLICEPCVYANETHVIGVFETFTHRPKIRRFMAGFYHLVTAVWYQQTGVASGDKLATTIDCDHTQPNWGDAIDE